MGFRPPPPHALQRWVASQSMLRLGTGAAHRLAGNTPRRKPRQAPAAQASGALPLVAMRRLRRDWSGVPRALPGNLCRALLFVSPQRLMHPAEVVERHAQRERELFAGLQTQPGASTRAL